jgi:hypothetical protein
MITLRKEASVCARIKDNFYVLLKICVGYLSFAPLNLLCSLLYSAPVPGN